MHCPTTKRKNGDGITAGSFLRLVSKIWLSSFHVSRLSFLLSASLIQYSFSRSFVCGVYLSVLFASLNPPTITLAYQALHYPSDYCQLRFIPASVSVLTSTSDGSISVSFDTFLRDVSVSVRVRRFFLRASLIPSECRPKTCASRTKKKQRFFEQLFNSPRFLRSRTEPQCRFRICSFSLPVRRGAVRFEFVQ